MMNEARDMFAAEATKAGLAWALLWSSNEPLALMMDSDI